MRFTHGSSSIGAPISAGGTHMVPTTTNVSGTGAIPCAGSTCVAPTVDNNHKEMEGAVPSDHSQTNSPNDAAK